ncbi:MAG: prepilin-type N-terminal cleavage/methylation domain-containing protein [Deltaproteobacteria bacterium]|nr:prepilin-type N-terminal cleavage/methylation domain-containing protein [Deltaproteobacteria bacterium]NIS78211.1 prepilin-type N-terminal cleavage/methylation domain-containing protein [Deltaproteobacteria bacterium]
MKKNRDGKRGESGFTMIEVMIVTVILSIVAFMAVPSFMGTIKRNKVKRAAAEIADNINLTRSHGIKEAVMDYRIVFDPGNDRYLCGFENDADSDPDGFGSGGSKIVGLSTYSPEITFGSDAPNGPNGSLACGGAIPASGVSGWGTPPVLNFNSDGSVPNLGCVFIRDQSGNNFMVSVESVVGKTNLWRWEGGNVWSKVY